MESPAHDHREHDEPSAPRAPVPRLHHGRSAQRAFVSRQHNGPPTTEGHDGRLPRRRVVHEKGIADHVPQRPNGLALSCAAPIDRQDVRAHLTAKSATISGRAAASATAPCWAATPADRIHMDLIDSHCMIVVSAPACSSGLPRSLPLFIGWLAPSAVDGSSSVVWVTRGDSYVESG